MQCLHAADLIRAAATTMNPAAMGAIGLSPLRTSEKTKKHLHKQPKISITDAPKNDVVQIAKAPEHSGGLCLSC